jgi:predicted Rossmann fold flavoprotein
MTDNYDVIIIGAGAAGMMCAIEASKRGKKTWLVDHAKKIAEKIRISGGGRCNFTNIHTSPANFLSQNKHFCKSALSRYTPQDFITLIESHNISWHEKTLGQLFCDESSQNIIDMLIKECNDAGVVLSIDTSIKEITYTDPGIYTVQTSSGNAKCSSLVIATGGLSIPKIGASKFGYDVARQFGLKVIETKPALVPLTFQSGLLEKCKQMTGMSVDATITSQDGISFSEGMLFTHRGLSGPSILQVSSYWKEGEELIIDLLRGYDVLNFLKQKREESSKQSVKNTLASVLPKRLAEDICEDTNVHGNIAETSDKKLEKIAKRIKQWYVKPSGTEGYRTAEVTLGGVDTKELSSKTMESVKQPGLYFIGEVVDVTGHLGGYNFQWAWSSGYAAGQFV